ncbi:hypothetical protein [Leuconostoc falkenbergense]
MKKVAYMVLVMLLGIVACWSVGKMSQTKKSATSAPKVVLTGKSHKANSVAQAKLDYQQYNYAKSLKSITNDNSSKAKALKKEIEASKSDLVTWNDPDKYSHLFFHSLIVDPTRAFTSQKGQGYKDYMVTIDEFNKMLTQLYAKGYVLVNSERLVKKNDKGELVFDGVSLPKGKTPLVLSQDDVNYYEYMINSGFASKLVATKNGIKNEYIDANGKTSVGNYDLVPIVDEFIKAHPDFSYRGDKGTLAVTGYNGVLGYRTSVSQYGDTAKTKRETKKALKVVAALKADGWNFASHSWGHLNMKTASVADVKLDTDRWEKEVQPVVGKTNILIFPFGADIGDWQGYQDNIEKFAYLRQKGFEIYENVDASHMSWGEMTTKYYRQARINVDGIRMTDDLNGTNSVLNPFFNTSEVIDSTNRNK